MVGRRPRRAGSIARTSSDALCRGLHRVATRNAGPARGGRVDLCLEPFDLRSARLDRPLCFHRCNTRNQDGGRGEWSQVPRRPLMAAAVPCSLRSNGSWPRLVSCGKPSPIAPDRAFGRRAGLDCDRALRDRALRLTLGPCASGARRRRRADAVSTALRLRPPGATPRASPRLPLRRHPNGHFGTNARRLERCRIGLNPQSVSQHHGIRAKPAAPSSGHEDDRPGAFDHLRHDET